MADFSVVRQVGDDWLAAARFTIQNRFSLPFSHRDFISISM